MNWDETLIAQNRAPMGYPGRAMATKSIGCFNLWLFVSIASYDAARLMASKRASGASVNDCQTRRGLLRLDLGGVCGEESKA